MAIFGMSDLASDIKNETALCCLPSIRFAAKCRAPLTLR